MRLKNVQLSYRTNATIMQKVGVTDATFSLIGENLHVWDKLQDKIFDPVQATGNGARYPLQRIFTLQVHSLQIADKVSTSIHILVQPQLLET